MLNRAKKKTNMSWSDKEGFFIGQSSQRRQVQLNPFRW